MRAKILDFFRGLRSTYWFVPACMAVLAVLASLLTTWVDVQVGDAWFEDHLWMYTNQPDGARAVLSTVAGSMIGVAGVTFSIAIASVSYAAGQLGPRLITNFMRDRGNQYTLGTFIAAFLYSLMVLRTVRGGSADGADFQVDAFVPQVSVLCSLALAVASTAVLIYFIHHVPEGINAQNITARIGHALAEAVDEQFPGRVGVGPAQEADADPPHPDRGRLPAGFGEQARVVASAASGYVRSVDAENLMALAEEQDLVVRLRARPGEFVATGQALMLVWPPERFDGEAEAEADAAGSSGESERAGLLLGELAGGGDLVTRCRGLISLGAEKTHHQNLLFLVDELVEIAARAVSPGTNDPFTAITAIDWLRSGLSALGEREPLPAERFGGGGVLRVLAEPASYEEALRSACAQLRPYVAADRNVALHLLDALGRLALRSTDPARRAVALAEAEELADATDASLPLAVDRELVRTRLISLALAAGS